MKKIGIVVGTRPEIIKCYPIHKELSERGIEHRTIFSNQHFSDNMGMGFFRELGWDISNIIDSTIYHPYEFKEKEQALGDLVLSLTRAIDENNIDIVIVQGDTNTAFAGAIAGKQLGLKVVHVEAGLRSWDERMIEEWNRRAIDHLSDIHFSPTIYSTQILKKETQTRNIPVYEVGNTVVDSLNEFKDRYTVDDKNYILFTFHRAENTWNKNFIEEIIHRLSDCAYIMGIDKVIFPVHPRIREMVDKMELPDNVDIRSPFSYFQFIGYLKNARFVVSDSGGIQEEACALKVPCVTIREKTERQETIHIGSNILIKIKDLPKMVNKIRDHIGANTEWKNVYGDGNAGKKIVDILLFKMGAKEWGE